ncbi:Pentatricopeptide repeat-containing protein [Rhynchospora pubera]|uniref:Pentatricopeptide repeat-containing protein n=1 Tax=Rhynchospora pubera TaxID=906938 RepID=A0AAV8DC57_9POAL|nr:Pentatricopeptide repeat-containing protein [Rhynchospora pubera]
MPSPISAMRSRLVSSTIATCTSTSPSTSTSLPHPSFFSIFLLLRRPFSSQPLMQESDTPKEMLTNFIISDLSSLLSKPRSELHKHRSLEHLAPHLTPSHVSELFRTHSVDPEMALLFFESVSQLQGFKHDVHSHASLIGLLLRSKTHVDFEKVLISMVKSCEQEKDMGVVMDAFWAIKRTSFMFSYNCYKYLLKCLFRFYMTREMQSLCPYMIKDGIVPDVVVYNLMLKCYCKEGNLRKAHNCFKHLLGSSTPIDSFACNSMIQEYCKIGDLNKACWVILMMPLLGCQRNQFSYTMLIHGLCRLGHLNEALRLWDSMKIDKCAPNVHTYTVMIDNLCKNGDLDTAHKLLEEMSEKGVTPSVVTYNTIIGCYCKCGKVDNALRTLQLMRSKSCNPDTWTCGILIRGLCSNFRVSDAEALLNDFRRDLIPNLVSYRSLIEQYCQMGLLEDAFRVKSLMESDGCKPDMVLYTMLIEMLAKNGNLEEANKLLCEAFAEGLEPDVRTYTALVGSYCKVGKIDAVIEVMKFMESKGCAPNNWTYHQLIHGLCMNGKVEEAMAWFNKIVYKGVEPDIMMYTALIQGQCMKNHVNNALRLLYKMEKQGLMPDEFVFTILIESLCKVGRLNEAQSLFSTAFKMGFSANNVIYNTLMNGLLKAGQVEFSRSLVDKMVGIVPDIYAYSTLIHGLCEQSKLGEALEVLDEMLLKGIQPNTITYTTLIHEMLKEGSFDRASQMFDQMVNHRCKPNTVTCTVFIKAYFDTGQIKEAEDMFVEMERLGIKPDVVTYGVLIDGFSNFDLLDHAYGILKQMMDGDTCNPDFCVYSDLIKHLLRRKACTRGDACTTWKDTCGMWNELGLEIVFQLLDEMINYGCTPDVTTYFHLIEGFCKAGRLEEANTLFNTMKEKDISPNENIFNILVNCCFETKSYQTGLGFMGAMRELGFQPRLDSYRRLIVGFCEEGLFGEAKTAFCELLGLKKNHDEVAWEILIEGLVKQGNVSECYELLSVMEEEGCVLCSETYELIAREVVSQSDLASNKSVVEAEQ